MNILLTSFCNKSCPYCFAKGKLLPGETPEDSYISFKNLRVVINFLKKSKQKNIGLLGGEPTLHPRFKKSVRMILDEGFKVTIFSNGLIGKDNISFLKGIDKHRCSILININAPETYKTKEWLIINRVLRILSEKISLGFTIYKKNFNMDFLLKLVKKYKLNSSPIRVGLAAPILGHNNRYPALKDHKSVAQKIVKFAEKCDNLNISFVFDCGFTLCSFTEEECGKLFYYNSPLRVYCLGPIDVAPDLTVWRCFATSMIWNKKLTDFKDLNEMNKFFNEKYKAFRKVGTTKDCLRCKYLKRKQCSGGCLGHTLKSFGLENNMIPH